MPKEEFDKRSVEFSKLLTATHYPNRVDAQIYRHDHESFAETAERYQNEPEGGSRCRECFYIRLEKTASLAKSQKHDCFATALTVSPHKNAAFINEIGSEVSRRYQIEYIASDFKKQNGYNRSVELSKLYGLYRQNYCGCRPHFAKKEGM
jgi:predicted adenine nucleotide alpha hydrolase (AANH) superfamily ATPase